MVDVLIVGAGPAGRAVAAACADTGLATTVVDPAPRRGWPHTYGSWLDELPAAVPHSALGSVTATMRTFGTSPHDLARPYAVLDNSALWKHLWRPDVQDVTGRVVGAEHGPTGSTVHLKDGRRLAAATVVDATGAARVLSGGRPSRTAAQQSAVGVVLDPAAAEPLCPEGSGVFMDWRSAPDTRGGWPTFLYCVRFGSGQVLMEETSLARRPSMPLTLLRRRLHGRLAAAGITVPDDAAEERVRFPVDDPIPLPGRVVPFGASGGLVHPASGFSVASALRQAPWVAGALSAGLTSGPAKAAKAAWSILWPPRAMATHGLRRRALRALLTFPPALVPEFFEVFFSLPEADQAAFLAADHDPARTAAAMTTLFSRAPWPVRRRLVAGGFGPGGGEAQHGFGGL
ncbi:lycopene cyclase family protein [Saccharopolyspora sp. NFXS83]|uniref:lycopene cyclase family protein n=1 Tax=Saccharopolyspora sp. NFXS83 TaxID=2993560 RepID=UPI00224A52E5|nr:lycopene cyclase family protein [Saccharopolyspora sp. NFXS83]MCX2734099.1 lycopene cyclase family protein [Saccharopolyspora sp. NFXS83]